MEMEIGQSPRVASILTMRQFEWRWLCSSVWVSALHIPVGVGHRWMDTWGTTPSTTSFHVRLPQPKFKSRRNLLVCFVVTANALIV